MKAILQTLLALAQSLVLRHDQPAGLSHIVRNRLCLRQVGDLHRSSDSNHEKSGG